MDLKQFEKLIKLMGMTTSQHDGECLNAIRAANAILMGANRDWDDILRSKVTVKKVEGVSTNPKYAHGSVGGGSSNKHTDDSINEMFDMVMKNTPEHHSFYGFIKSLHDYWELNGFLTDKQYNALRKAYGNVR